jgi:hypothetical protein
MKTRFATPYTRCARIGALTPLLAGALALVACGDDGTAETADDTGSASDTDEDTDTADPTTDTMTASATLTTTTATSTDTEADTSTTEPADTTEADTTADESSSTGEPVVCELKPGATWDAPDWEANTVDAYAVRAALDALVGDPLMRGAETSAVELTGIEQLEAAWDGDPSLADAANPAFATFVALVFQEFVDVIDAGEQDLIDAGGDWAPGAAGGVWGDADRGINEGGLEVRQFVDKGSFGGGLLYAWAVTQTEGDIDPATIDAIAAVWGNNAALDPMSKETPLTDGASYSYQMGFHGSMVAALADAKQFAADEACTAERDAALVQFFNLWEQSMLARTIFYGNRAAGKLLVAETDTQFADVLHDLGEGLGLAVGFVGLPDPASGPLAGGVRIITDEQALDLLEAYGIDVAAPGSSTTGLLLESLPDLETANEAAQGVVMDTYSVDAGVIQTYLMPTAG